MNRILPKIPILFWIALTVTSLSASDEIPFEKHALDLGPCETVTVADINKDNLLDIVSGDYWFEQSPQGGRD